MVGAMMAIPLLAIFSEKVIRTHRNPEVAHPSISEKYIAKARSRSSGVTAHLPFSARGSMVSGRQK
jgi:hypothetical protein